MRIFVLCLALTCLVNAAVRFEVASVKPANPENSRLNMARDLARISMPASAGLPIQGRRLVLRGTTLEHLIALAYQVQPRQISGPSWLTEKRFDVEAIIGTEDPIEQAREMLQNLLKERFGLRTHIERRDQPGYILTVDKRGHRLQPAAANPNPNLDPVQLTLSRKPGVPGIQRREFKNCDMPHLTNSIAGLLQAHVEDRTGLKGRYDAVLAVAPPRDADDIDLQPRVIDAVATLGLQLKSNKIAVELLVIDAIEKTPLGN